MNNKTNKENSQQKPKKPIFCRKPFSPEEDAKLVELVSTQRFLNWQVIASLLPGRSARQCRERWSEYLDPSIKFQPWTNHEDTLLVQLVQIYGNKWTFISKIFNGRTGNDVKNRWHSHLKGVVYTDVNGNLQILRNEKGEIISNKKKRKRNHINVNQNAYLHLEQKYRQQMGLVNLPPVSTFINDQHAQNFCLKPI